MLSCHPDPFTAFCTDLQIPGCEVHLYKGPNTFGTLLPASYKDDLLWWNTDNVYFLAGVKPSLQKRAADIDVLKRGMFTLDFDIKKEIEKMKPEGLECISIDGGKEPMERMIGQTAENIIDSLIPHPMWGKFRYVVLSGNGMHVHYFGEPCIVEKESWVAGMKNIFAEVAKITPITPDFGCGNAGRIMRMPGSWNMKDPTNPKPVDIIIWMPTASLPPLKFVQERGMIEIERSAMRQEAKKAEFIENGGEASDLINLINCVPIEQVVAQLFAGMRVKQVKKDGGLRFEDDKGEERGFFKHHEFNIVIHEGTSLFQPPSGKGYNPLGLVKATLNLNAHDAIQWFCARSTKIRELNEKERAEWLEESNTQHIFDVKEEISQMNK